MALLSFALSWCTVSTSQNPLFPEKIVKTNRNKNKISSCLEKQSSWMAPPSLPSFASGSAAAAVTYINIMSWSRIYIYIWNCTKVMKLDAKLPGSLHDVASILHMHTYMHWYFSNGWCSKIPERVLVWICSIIPILTNTHMNLHRSCKLTLDVCTHL